MAGMFRMTSEQHEAWKARQARAYADQRLKADAPPANGTIEARVASRAPDQQQAGRTVSRVAHNHEIPGATPGPASNDVLTLPWPPTGNTSVRHGKGGHYLTQDVRDYRAAVGVICRDYAPVKGRYRLHVHLSPPDKRRRDADNAIKNAVDALVLAGYIQDDAMAYMRELVVTVDDEPCYGWAKVRVVPMEEFAA